MAVHRVLAQRLELWASAARLSHENEDVIPTWCIWPVVVEQAQQQRADVRARSVLVPAEAGHGAVGRPRVLDLEHRPLAWLVHAGQWLGHDTVKAGALEALEPVAWRRSASKRCRRQVDRRLRLGQGLARSVVRRSPCGVERRS